MTTALFRELIADPIKASVLGEEIAKTICRVAGINPKGKAVLESDPDTQVDAWTTFYNDARMMMLDQEDRLRAQAGETPLVRVLQR